MKLRELLTAFEDDENIGIDYIRDEKEVNEPFNVLWLSQQENELLNADIQNVYANYDLLVCISLKEPEKYALNIEELNQKIERELHND